MADEPQEKTLTESPEIPNRLFFRIGDVADLAGLEAYVLRYWETEFPGLRPKKTSNGQRQYRRKDVEVVLEIKRLLYDDGYTIAGARKALKDKQKAKKARPARKTHAQGALFADPRDDSEALNMIKKDLQEILGMLA